MAVPVPSLDEVAAALGKDADDVEAAYLAEVDAQAAACRVDPYGSDLAQALVRRVQRALHMKNLPLGVTLDENAIRVGSSDPEVRRLEAPHRKVVLG